MSAPTFPNFSTSYPIGQSRGFGENMTMNYGISDTKGRHCGKVSVEVNL
ncbi:MAG: hypothetical protein ABI986_03465 [Chloroflexota bacterium]